MKFEIKTRIRSKQLKDKVLSLFSEDFLKDIPARIIMIIGGVLIVAIWLVGLFRFQITEYQVPTRYNSFIGVTELGSWYRLYQVPFFVLINFLINIMLANAVFKKDKMIAYIFLAINIFIAIAALSVVINLSLLLDY